MSTNRRSSSSSDIRFATCIYDDSLLAVFVGSSPVGSIERDVDGWYAVTSSGREAKVPFGTAREAAEALVAQL